MLDRIGQPTSASVMPYDSTTRRCPSAVPPPWLPIAGTMNGRAPSPLRCSTIARVIAAMSAMPRLPAVTATVWPGWTLRPSSSRASCRPTSPGTSSTRSASNVWRRRKICGKERFTVTPYKSAGPDSGASVPLGFCGCRPSTYQRCSTSTSWSWIFASPVRLLANSPSRVIAASMRRFKRSSVLNDAASSDGTLTLPVTPRPANRATSSAWPRDRQSM